MDDEHLQKQLNRMDAMLQSIHRTLHGNGEPGLKTQVALLNAWKSTMARAFWVVVGASATSFASAIVALIANLV